MKDTKVRVLLVVLICVFSQMAFADVRLPSVIDSRMVLQQGSDARIWGWAEPGEKVSISASWKRNARATAGKDGKWLAKIQTPKAGGPYTITVKGNNTITLENVLLGEVWVCSGQSNMQWSLKNTEDAEKHIVEANFPNIRLFKVTRAVASEPQEDCEGNWAECSPETVAGFSAVAYYFGRKLYEELDVPIGLIHSSWGGTPAEAWTRKEYLEKDDVLKPILERHKLKIENLPNAEKWFPKKYKEWQQQAEEAKAKGKRVPKAPEKPTERNQRDPSSLYNGMIAPLIPYGIKGAIWYQGEANVIRSWQYRKLFPTMITNWRKDWKQGNFPFYYVQLAPFNYGEERPSEELREAQFMTLSLAKTGMAVTMDIGDPTNIHPTNKLDVGKRLALWALAKDYGMKKLVYSGPLYKSKKIERDKIRLSFNHVGSGLISTGGELTHFTIAGSDKEFVDAKAVIDGKTIVVSSD
ncbi:MAG: sialate O-acetylesterase, partial [Planctomycetes bacterium]|nr:sialate O-acetylesterase [Planctomycetota bacterium]